MDHSTAPLRLHSHRRAAHDFSSLPLDETCAVPADGPRRLGSPPARGSSTRFTRIPKSASASSAWTLASWCSVKKETYSIFHEEPTWIDFLSSSASRWIFSCSRASWLAWRWIALYKQFQSAPTRKFLLPRARLDYWVGVLTLLLPNQVSNNTFLIKVDFTHQLSSLLINKRTSWGRISRLMKSKM